MSAYWLAKGRCRHLLILSPYSASEQVAKKVLAALNINHNYVVLNLLLMLSIEVVSLLVSNTGSASKRLTKQLYHYIIVHLGKSKTKIRLLAVWSDLLRLDEYSLLFDGSSMNVMNSDCYFYLISESRVVYRLYEMRPSDFNYDGTFPSALCAGALRQGNTSKD